MASQQSEYINALSRRLQKDYSKSAPVYSEGYTPVEYRPLESGVSATTPDPTSGLPSLNTPVDLGTDSWLDTHLGPKSPAGRVIDVLSRPVYAIGSYLDQISDTIGAIGDVQRGDLSKVKQHVNPNIRRMAEAAESKNPLYALNAAFNMGPGAMLSGLSGRTKTLPSEALLGDVNFEGGPHIGSFNVGEFGAGLATDIALDPLTYVPIAGIASAIGKGAGRAGKGILKAQDAIDAPKIINDVSAFEGAKNVGKTAAADIPNAAPIKDPLGLNVMQKIENGTYTPPVTRQTSTVNDLLQFTQDGYVSGSGERALRNIKSGEVREFKPGLKNIKTSKPVYGKDIVIDSPFVEGATEAIADAIKVTPGRVAKMPKTAVSKADGTKIPLVRPEESVDEFIERIGNSVTVPHPNGGDLIGIKDLADEAAQIAADMRAGASRGSKAEIAKNQAIRRAVPAVFTEGKKAYTQWIEAVQKAGGTIAGESAESIAQAVSRAPGVAEQAVRKGAPPVSMLKGDAYEAWKATFREILHSEDYARIIAAKTPEEFDATVAAVLGRQDKFPIFEDVFRTPAGRLVTSEMPKPLEAAKKPPVRDSVLSNTKPASEIIEEADTSITAVDSRIVAKQQAADAFPVMPEHIQSILTDVMKQQGWTVDLSKEGFPFRSGKTLAARTDKTPGQGLGIHDRSANLKFQGNLFKRLVDHHSKILTEANKSLSKPLKYERWSKAISERVVPELKQIDDLLRANGIEPALTIQSKGYPISLVDIIEAADSYKLTGTTSGRLKNTGRQILMTRLFSAFGYTSKYFKGPGGAPRAMSRFTVDADALGESLRVVLDYVLSGAPKAPKGNLAKGVAAALTKVDSPDIAPRVRATLSSEKRPLTSLQKVDPKKPAVEVPFNAADDAEKVMKGVTEDEIIELLTNPEFMTEIVQRVYNNAARFGLEVIDETHEITEQSIKYVADVLQNPNATIDETVEALTKTGERIEEMTKGKNVHEASVEGAKLLTDEEMLKVTTLGDIERAKNFTKMDAAISAGRRSDKARRLGQEQHLNSASEAMRALSASDIASSGAVTEQVMYTSIQRKVMPFESKTKTFWEKIGDAFVPHLGHATLAPARQVVESLGRSLNRSFINDINRIVQMGIPKDRMASAFKMMQSGKSLDELPPDLRQAADAMHGVLDELFEANPNGASVMSAFFRNGADIEHINMTIKSAGRRAQGSGNVPARPVGDYAQFDVEAATNAAKTSGKSVAEELASQWKSWDIDDPIDFMMQMRYAMYRTSVEMTTVQEAVRIASSKNFLTTQPAKGFVKVVWDDPTSPMAKYFPQDAYIHPDILSELKSFDTMLRESRTLTGGFGEFINGHFLPYQNAWKLGMTIYRPGHHMRNLVGDMSLTYLAEGARSLKPEYSRIAMRMMGMRGRYDGWDYLKAMEGMEFSLKGPGGKLDPMGNQEIVAKISLGRKGRKELSAEELHTGLMKRGVFPEYATQEDILDDMARDTFASKITSVKPTGGRARNFAGGVSQARDDYVRITHALAFLQKQGRKFKDVDDALDQAAAQVRKWHPDGSNLTSFESKYMRTVFPFYSWTRKAIPLIIEATLMNPGRVLAYPKATYHFANANGIEVPSLSDPFPVDQMFPSFLTDSPTGPMAMVDGKYWGFNPGVASMDVYREFFSDPKGGAAGMVSPLLKAPLEMMSGRNLQTGAKINDMGEYLDSQLPFVTTAAGMSGYSVTGSLAGMMSGEGLDPQTQVVKGNKGHFDPESFINYLFGLGISNMSKQSYINVAEMERRDQAAAEMKRAGLR